MKEQFRNHGDYGNYYTISSLGSGLEDQGDLVSRLRMGICVVITSPIGHRSILAKSS